MLVVPKAADDMMNVGRLNNFPGKLTAQGKLIKQELLLFCDITPALDQLDASTQAQIISQYEENYRRKMMATNNNQDDIGSSSSTSAAGGANKETPPELNSDDLHPSNIGNSSMTDRGRIVLNHLLNQCSTASGSGSMKLRERQTFLFEQNIIFGEIQQRGKSSKSSSSNSSDGAFYHHGSGGGGGGSYQSVGAYNSHPCAPHSHGPQGQVELCCYNQDCQIMPRTPSQYCDRTTSGSLCQTSPDLLQLIRPAHHHHYQSPTGAYASSSSASTSGGASSNYYMATPSYEYKNHLSINKLTLIDKPFGSDCSLDRVAEILAPAQSSFDFESYACRFLLKSRDPNQGNVIYLLQTGCSLDRDDWVSSIKSMLECQLDFLRALQSPIAYQRGLTKEGSTPEFANLWNPELRKTLSNNNENFNYNKFHKRIPSLFSHHHHSNSTGSNNDLCLGSVDSTSCRSTASSGSKSSWMKQQSSQQQQNSSFFVGGNVKYLRFVRNKLSKKGLLGLTLSSNSSNPPSASSTTSSSSSNLFLMQLSGNNNQQQQQKQLGGENGARNRKAFASEHQTGSAATLTTLDCVDDAEIDECVGGDDHRNQMETLVRHTSERLHVSHHHHHQANAINELERSHSELRRGSQQPSSKSHKQATSHLLEIGSSGKSTSKTKSSSTLARAFSTANANNPAGGTKKSSSSSFFQGFRYTLRGRRGSKASKKLQQQQAQAEAEVEEHQQQQQQQQQLSSSEVIFQQQQHQQHSMSQSLMTNDDSMLTTSLADSSSLQSTSVSVVQQHQKHQFESIECRREENKHQSMIMTNNVETRYQENKLARDQRPANLSDLEQTSPNILTDEQQSLNTSASFQTPTLSSSTSATCNYFHFSSSTATSNTRTTNTTTTTKAANQFDQLQHHHQHDELDHDDDEHDDPDLSHSVTSGSDSSCCVSFHDDNMMLDHHEHHHHEHEQTQYQEERHHIETSSHQQVHMSFASSSRSMRVVGQQSTNCSSCFSVANKAPTSEAQSSIDRKWSSGCSSTSRDEDAGL